MNSTRDKPADPRSRRRLLERLKQDGPQDARALAGRLGISAMAVRQHLYQLQNEKLVAYDEQPRPVGRPAKLWRLTEAANRYFPDAHATLAVELIASLTKAFGSGGLEQLVALRAQAQTKAYRDQMPRRASLRRRLEKLAAIRTAEGYMAEVLPQGDGSFLLVENHCPICAAATACNGLCAAELAVFQSVLGERVRVERTEHILQAARRCAYRVRKAAK